MFQLCPNWIYFSYFLKCLFFEHILATVVVLSILTRDCLGGEGEKNFYRNYCLAESIRELLEIILVAIRILAVPKLLQGKRVKIIELQHYAREAGIFRSLENRRNISNLDRSRTFNKLHILTEFRIPYCSYTAFSSLAG